MKKALIVTEYIPTPTNNFGVFMRFGAFLQVLSHHFALDFIFFVSPTSSVPVEEIGKWTKQVFKVDAHTVLLCPKQNLKPNESYRDEYLQPALNAMFQPKYKRVSGGEQVEFVEKHQAELKPDLIFAHRLSAMCSILLAKNVTAPIIFDLDDIEHKVLFRDINSEPKWPGKQLWYLKIPALMSLERKAVKLARKTFVCSEKDVRYLEKLYGVDTVRLIPNSIEIPEESNAEQTEKSILFLGSYSYPPNVNAAEYLIKKVWPLVLEAMPEAKLYIAGNLAENIPSYANAGENVEFTGFVADLAELYSKIRVVCCPIFVAGGTRIKIIEAAAYGKAVVSSEIGAEGLGLADGEEIIIKNDANDMAAACVELLQDSGYAAALGSRARAAVIRKFDIKNISKMIEKQIEDLNL